MPEAPNHEAARSSVRPSAVLRAHATSRSPPQARAQDRYSPTRPPAHQVPMHHAYCTGSTPIPRARTAPRTSKRRSPARRPRAARRGPQEDRSFSEPAYSIVYIYTGGRADTLWQRQRRSRKKQINVWMSKSECASKGLPRSCDRTLGY